MTVDVLLIVWCTPHTTDKEVIDLGCEFAARHVSLGIVLCRLCRHIHSWNTHYVRDLTRHWHHREPMVGSVLAMRHSAVQGVVY